MHVGAAHVDVAGPPREARAADHVGARPDEAERAQEGDQKEELGLLAGVDDPALVRVREVLKDGGRQRTRKAGLAWKLDAPLRNVPVWALMRHGRGMRPDGDCRKEAKSDEARRQPSRTTSSL
jgi:hypothetical protein